VLVDECNKRIITSFEPEAIVNVPVQEVRAGEPGQLRIDLTMPSGYHLNPQAPFSYRIAVDGTGVTVAEADRQFSAMAPNLKWPLLLPFQAAPDVALLVIADANQGNENKESELLAVIRDWLAGRRQRQTCVCALVDLDSAFYDRSRCSLSRSDSHCVSSGSRGGSGAAP
jgi:hypothetical protein